MTLRRSPLPLSLVALLTAVCAGQAAPLPGFTAAALIARAYDSILNADFAVLPGALATACGPASFDQAQDSPDPSTSSGSSRAQSRDERSRGAPSEACDTLEAVGLWWQIALDPDDRSFDAQFSKQVGFAIGATDAWTKREPERAEAWFYHGAAYGARVQWRVLRGARLAAARDGKRIKESMERALALDPGMHDAKFGVGMYRYYAAAAPAALRMLRWLLMLPGGDRAGGLRQMIAAHNDGRLVRGEADYQLHVIYLWYEHRFDEALALIDSLRARYPRNPLFHQARAEILDTYFHDQTASLRTWEDLLLRARARLVSEPDLAATRAKIKAAELLDRLDETDRAVELLQQVIVDRPSRPARAVPAATAMIPRMRERLAHEPYRIALQGWRAFERGDLVGADRMFTQSLLADPSSLVTRYRYAQVLMADGRDTHAVEELDRVLAMTTKLSPIVRANALFDSAHLAERRGDRTRAQTLYLEASRVFGADRTITERAARLARALEGGARREIALLERELTSRGRLKLSVEASIGCPF